MTSHDLVKRASRRLYRKRDGIGQTPCSYERYLVEIDMFIVVADDGDDVFDKECKT